MSLAAEYEALVAIYLGHCERFGAPKGLDAVTESLMVGSFSFGFESCEIPMNQLQSLSEFVNDVEMSYRRLRKPKKDKPSVWSAICLRSVSFLSACPFSDSPFDNLSIMLRWVQHIDVSNVLIGNEGCADLVKGLSKNEHLKALMLDQCGISDHGLDALGTLLTHSVHSLLCFRFANSEYKSQHAVQARKRGHDFSVDAFRDALSVPKRRACENANCTSSAGFRSLLRGLAFQKDLQYLDFGGIILGKLEFPMIPHIFVDSLQVLHELRVLVMPSVALNSWDHVDWATGLNIMHTYNRNRDVFIVFRDIALSLSDTAEVSPEMLDGSAFIQQSRSEWKDSVSVAHPHFALQTESYARSLSDSSRKRMTSTSVPSLASWIPVASSPNLNKLYKTLESPSSKSMSSRKDISSSSSVSLKDTLAQTFVKNAPQMAAKPSSIRRPSNRSVQEFIDDSVVNLIPRAHDLLVRNKGACLAQIPQDGDVSALHDELARLNSVLSLLSVMQRELINAEKKASMFHSNSLRIHVTQEEYEWISGLSNEFRQLSDTCAQRIHDVEHVQGSIQRTIRKISSSLNTFKASSNSISKKRPQSAVVRKSSFQSGPLNDNTSLSCIRKNT
eukprot:ANDGO_03169.mRNA.1 hypothetical protein